MTDKPFKGVISDWWVEEITYGVEIVHGLCIWHADSVPLPAALLGPIDKIVRGEAMHTSRIVKLDQRATYALLETKNSVYILISPRRASAAQAR